MADQPINEIKKKIAVIAREAYASGKIEPRKKCCGKCAFRKGSPERIDPWGWLSAVEGWCNKEKPIVFFCHEGIKGHPQQEDKAPLHVCAGYHAMQGQHINTWANLAHMDDREQEEKFKEGYE